MFKRHVSIAQPVFNEAYFIRSEAGSKRVVFQGAQICLLDEVFWVENDLFHGADLVGEVDLE